MADEQLAAGSAAIAKAMGEVPIQSMLRSLGMGIADAQARLDTNSIRTARQLAETTVDLLDADGNPIARSLLELGFLPSFYHFSEVTISVSMSVSMRMEESSTVGVGVKLGGTFSSTSAQSAQQTQTQTT